MKIYHTTKVFDPFSKYENIPEDILQHAAIRGTKTHRACGSYALGLYPILNDEIAGYFESFKAWFDRYVDRVFFVEKQFIDETLGYSGTPDMGIAFKDGGMPVNCIVDLKTPIQAQKTWRCQLAAYLQLAGPDYQFGMVLQLDKDGKHAKAIRYQYSNQDFSAFLSCLNAYRYFDS